LLRWTCSTSFTRAVLRAFGLAYDRFRDDQKGSHSKFLDQAVVELAQDGKVAPVRLALFAQMINDKPWTQATLKDVGGLEGIGVTFLEESLASPGANPEHRLHLPAARRILQAVLPEGGADIKGHMRSYDELLDASGYAHGPRDFDTLLEILSTELRLITPTDPGGSHPDNVERSGHRPGRYYHLTHDYLVSSVRSWLTHKQRETRRGRAEIRLSAITNLWKDRPATRRLPSLLEWLEVLALTRPRFWSTDERRMIRAATRHYLTGLGLAVCLIMTATYTFLEFRTRERSSAVFARAVKAELRQVPDLLDEVGANWQRLLPSLKRLEKEPALPERDRRMVALLLYSGEPTEQRAAVLRRSLVAARPDEVAVIRDVLAMHPDRSGADSLKRAVFDESTEPTVRLRAACVLAKVRPADVAEENNLANSLTQALLAEERRTLGGWIELLRPSLGLFLAPLSGICRDPRTDSSVLSIAAEALGEALVRRGDSVGLGRAVVESRPEASSILRRDISRLEHPGPALDFMRGVLKHEQADESRQELVASWKVNACVALASVGEPQALWLQLQHRPDPRVRASLIRRMGASGINPSILIERLTTPDLDPAERQGLLLGFADTSVTALPAHARKVVADYALRLYEEDPHAAVCSAAELLLRRWGAPPKPYADGDAKTAARTGHRDSPGLLIGPNGHVFAVLFAPLEFRMGSPEYERGRSADETLHFRRINRTLAVATKELTIEQFRKFSPTFYPGLRDDQEPGHPANDLSWYDAVGYCNWLSKEAGIDADQWCYPATIAPGMRISAAAVDRHGFRLPTEAEWEYFCRAGTETTRPLGVSEDSLSGFGWTWLNSGDRTHPTGLLLPNEFGLFDVLGNVWELCHNGPLTDTYVRPPYPAATREHPASDSLADETIKSAYTWRSLRGGAFDYTPTTARSAHRDVFPVEKRGIYLGMRVVRTLPTTGHP
jgi:eukaryotic-like serine/threonine-protein kinase